MVEALTSIRTSPWPSTGTGTLLISTVLFPGRNAAFIILDILSYLLVRLKVTCFALRTQGALTGLNCLCRSNDAVDVPKVFPRLIVLPKEHLSLDEAAVAVQLLDCVHILLAERLADYPKQIAQDVFWVR